MTFVYSEIFYGEDFGIRTSPVGQTKDEGLNGSRGITNTPELPSSGGDATGSFDISSVLAQVPSDDAPIDLIAVGLRFVGLAGASRVVSFSPPIIEYYADFRGFAEPILTGGSELIFQDQGSGQVVELRKDIVVDFRPLTTSSINPVILWEAWVTPTVFVPEPGAFDLVAALTGSLANAFPPGRMGSLFFKVPWTGFGNYDTLAQQGIFRLTAQLKIFAFQVGVPVPIELSTIEVDIGPDGILPMTQLLQGAGSGTPDIATPQTLRP